MIGGVKSTVGKRMKVTKITNLYYVLDDEKGAISRRLQSNTYKIT